MKVTDLLVSPNQTAFVQGRTIYNNTLLSDEILYGFGRAKILRG